MKRVISRPPFKDNSSPIKFLKWAPEVTNVFIEFLLNYFHIVLRLCQILWIWKRPGTGSAGKIFAVTGNLPYQNAFCSLVTHSAMIWPDISDGQPENKNGVRSKTLNTIGSVSLRVSQSSLTCLLPPPKMRGRCQILRH